MQRVKIAKMCVAKTLIDISMQYIQRIIETANKIFYGLSKKKARKKIIAYI